MPEINPCLYLLLLSAAVGLGLPSGALVVGAGALFGPGLGLLTVLLAEAIGLVINWRLCRGLEPTRRAVWSLRARSRQRRPGSRSSVA